MGMRVGSGFDLLLECADSLCCWGLDSSREVLEFGMGGWRVTLGGCWGVLGALEVFGGTWGVKGGVCCGSPVGLGSVVMLSLGIFMFGGPRSLGAPVLLVDWINGLDLPLVLIPSSFSCLS